ncbi:MAG: zinc dependent phospholipase C family protein [Methylophilaceae bacterium]|jgi:hypothetical protein
MSRTSKILCLIVLTLHSSDVFAWGLGTHVYFAHSLLWAMPALNSKFRRAVLSFPSLVMAGACLPDLSIIDNKLKESHQWNTAFSLINQAETDEERAIALGYLSHLYIDVIAHNHFVPAHEAMWFEYGMCGHILSEWAMDGHLQPLGDDNPASLMKRNRRLLVSFLSDALNFPSASINRSLNKLIFWDNLLRRFQIPRLIHLIADKSDKRTERNFRYYLAQTHIAINQIQSVVDGETPNLNAELIGLNDLQLDYWRGKCLQDLHLVNPQAIRHF